MDLRKSLSIPSEVGWTELIVKFLISLVKTGYTCGMYIYLGTSDNKNRLV